MRDLNLARRLFVTVIATVLAAAAASAATVDGLKIHSASRGSGKATLVLVHGWTCDSSSWEGQVPELARKYRVITLDLPGHGKTPVPADGKFSMDLFARAVEAVRAEAGVDKVVLVGHSMGAPVIRQYARLYPGHVAGLVAVDGPLDMRQFPTDFKPPVLTGAEGRKTREGMIRGMFTPQTPPALQQKILTMMLAAPEATAIGAMGSIMDPALRKNEVTPMPALAVWAGTAQQMPKLEDARTTLPKYEQTQVVGTGHFLMMEKPEEFNRILTAFVDKLTF
jgi:pimeloyl-ACP methyl ester carboxylesterase